MIITAITGYIVYLQLRRTPPHGAAPPPPPHPTESLDIARKLGDQAGIALTLAQTALLDEKTGNLAEALKLIRQAEEIFQRLGVPQVERARRDRERLERGGKGATNKTRWQRMKHG